MNPIKASDLFSNDGAIRKLTEEIALLEDQLAKVKAESADLKKTLDKLNDSSDEQRQRISDSTEEAKRLNQAYKAYNRAIGENAQKIAELKAETQEANRIKRLTVKLNASEEGSYNKLSAQYSLLKIQLNKMGEATAEAAAEKRKLEKEAGALYERMKELQEATGKHTLNVGNYKSALEGLPGPLGRVSSGLEGVQGVFKALLRNPIVALFAAIAAAIATLGRAFLRTEKGARLFARATGYVQGLMSSLTRVASNVGEFLSKAFDDPLGAIQRLGESLVDNVRNRLTGVIDSAKNFGQAIGNWITGRTDEAREALGRLGGSLAQVATGLDQVQRQQLAAKLEEEARIAAANAKAFADLAERKFDVARANQQLLQQAAKLSTQEAIAQQRADDTTLSLRQQVEALDEAIAAGERRAALELQVAKNNLSIIDQEIAYRRRNGEDVLAQVEQQTAAIEALEQAQQGYTIFLADAARQRREILRDTFERELDFAIDLYDSQKTILERRANDDNNSLAQRAEYYARLQELDRSAFEQQIKLVEDFTSQRVNLEELALIDDERIVRERLRLLEVDDIVMGRILEILRERKLATQDILDVQRDLIAARREELGVIAPVDNLAQLRESADQAEEIRTKLAVLSAKRLQSQPGASAPSSIYDLLGFTVGDQEKQALSDAASFAVEQVQMMAAARVEAANKAVAASEREVAQAQAELQARAQLAEQGYAVNLQATEQELALAKQRQEQALKQQEQAEKEQRRLDTLQQASSLVTAAAKIFAEVPFPFSLAAVGTMLGSFILAKVRANKAVKYREGDFTVLGGKPHEDGGTFLGTREGVDEYAERGEGRAIFSRRAMKQYGALIPDLVESLNSLSFEQRFSRAAQFIGIPTAAAIDTSTMESHLSAIRANAERSVTFDARGNRIESYGNQTIIYRS